MAINRKNFITTNQYQRPVILLPVITSFIFCCIITYFILAFRQDLVADLAGKYRPYLHADVLTKWAILILFNLWVLFVIIVIQAFYLAGNMLGPFERLIKELDHGIKTKKPKKLQARKENTHALDLVQRINVLIEHYDPDKKQSQPPADRINKIKML